MSLSCCFLFPSNYGPSRSRKLANFLYFQGIYPFRVLLQNVGSCHPEYQCCTQLISTVLAILRVRVRIRSQKETQFLEAEGLCPPAFLRPDSATLTLPASGAPGNASCQAPQSKSQFLKTNQSTAFFALNTSYWCMCVLLEKYSGLLSKVIQETDRNASEENTECRERHSIPYHTHILNYFNFWNTQCIYKTQASTAIC